VILAPTAASFTHTSESNKIKVKEGPYKDKRDREGVKGLAPVNG
jgi:hypothetical protein